MYIFSFSPGLSNALGYGISLCTSYLLHRYFTFRSNGAKGGEFARFLILFAIAYGINYLTLHILLAQHVNPYVCQIGAGAMYVVASYVFGKIFVFKRHHVDDVTEQVVESESKR
jgi:putative flippase GtrA